MTTLPDEPMTIPRRSDYPIYTRAWWTVQRKCRDAYYWAWSLVKPHNIQRIRNVPRTWNDRSERLPHAVFSMLCDFVERECDGIDKLEARVKAGWEYADKIKAECEAGGYPLENSTYPLLKHQYDAEGAFCEIYRWYNAVNWKMPDGVDWSKVKVGAPGECERIRTAEETWWDKETEMLKRVIDLRGRLWT